MPRTDRYAPAVLAPARFNAPAPSGFQVSNRWYLVALLIVVANVGCRSATYYASDLPTEFQAPVISNTTDIDLARFARLSTSADVVEPGDSFEVTISTGLEERYTRPWQMRVDDDGVAVVPIVGPVQLGGLALSDADRAIYEAAVSRGYFRDPNVSVKRISRRENRITVAGAVKKPGSYALPVSSSDVLSALVAAGGLDLDADTIVEIRQPRSNEAQMAGRQGAQFASYQNGDSAYSQQREFQLDLANPQDIQDWDVALNDGAVISVRERPEHVVAVMGKVKRPGQFDIPNDGDLHVLDALAMAGGRATEFADKVYVVRQVDENADPLLIRVSVRDAKSDPAANLRLAPGDVVSVEETPLTFGLETITKFIRFGFSSPIPF